jgi:hypothetical protein
VIKQNFGLAQTFYKMYRLYGIKLETWEDLPQSIFELLADHKKVFRRDNNTRFIYAIALAFGRLGVPKNLAAHFLRGWARHAEVLNLCEATVNYAYKRVYREVCKGKLVVPTLYKDDPNISLNKFGLSDAQKTLLTTLYNMSYFQPLNQFSISYDLIAASAQAPRAATIYQIKQLVAKGYLNIIQRGTSHQPTTYRLTALALQTVEDELRDARCFCALQTKKLESQA